nr:hypothetical protein [Tanacetum cinerariifolium]
MKPMKQLQFSSCGSVHDQLSRLSPKYQWFVAQSAEADEDRNGDQFFYNIQDPLSFYRLYALNTDNHFYEFVIEIGIVVKDGGVVIELMLFAGGPEFPFDQGHEFMYFLRGYNTELFCISIGFNFHVITANSLVSLHKLDMMNIEWEKLEGLKKWDITGKRPGELEEEVKNMFKSSEIWDQVEDLKDGTFYVDLGRDNSVTYSPTIASEFGGNIHIRSLRGNVIYSYNLSDRTISLSSMFPSLLLPTSHVSVWECRLAADYAKPKQEVEDKDRAIVVRLVNDDDVELDESRLLNLPLGVLEMIMEFCIGLEYLNFRATCKLCHLAAPVVQWGGEVALKRLQNYSLLSPLAADYAKPKQEVEDKDRAIVVRLVNDDDVELDESRLLNLPLGVLEMIMEFCIGLEYLNFRATCKLCHLAAPVVQWGGEVALKRLQNYSLLSPWLMMADEKRGIVTFEDPLYEVFYRLSHHEKRGIVTFEDPLYDYKYFMKKLRAPIADGEVCYSGYGWLLYYSECELLEFCNPFTDEVHDLPKTENYFYSLFFSAPPTSPDCMVVGFERVGIFIHFVHGEQTWRLVSHWVDNDDEDDGDADADADDDDDDDDGLAFYCATFYGRDLYALCVNGKLHVFKNLGQEDYSWKQDVVEAPRIRGRSYPNYSLLSPWLMMADEKRGIVTFEDPLYGYKYFMKKLRAPIADGEVCYSGYGGCITVSVNYWSFVTPSQMRVGIFIHFVHGEQTWRLVSHWVDNDDEDDAHASALKPKRRKWKTIFFARFYNKNGKVVFYSLETRMYHTFNAKNIEEHFGDFVGTKYMLASFDGTERGYRRKWTW